MKPLLLLIISVVVISCQPSRMITTDPIDLERESRSVWLRVIKVTHMEEGYVTLARKSYMVYRGVLKHEMNVGDSILANPCPVTVYAIGCIPPYVFVRIR